MMKTPFDCLIFDADHTLLDYKADERGAFLRLFSSLSLTLDERQIERLHFLSEHTWSQAGLSDVASEYTQQNYHDLYRSHLRILFPRIFEELGVSADAGIASERFLKELEHTGNPIKGAEETLALLQKNYRLFVATNGLSAIQRGRLAVFGKRFEKLFISEEMGVIKPQKEFFDRILEEIGAKKETCLMIGDSLSSDIAGAKQSGLAAWWYNPTEQTNGSPFLPDRQIQDLKTLTELL